ncbi:MAG: hypothetical protein N0E55_09670, partial [Candidatus Thiodiazotropha taylori]|nr:hypothetical protein [Candidatus Thiodiazotropha taylori]
MDQVSIPIKMPTGDEAREAIASLRGYVYQIYQSVLAWTEIEDDEFLFLEVAEDFAVVAADALQAVQVKETSGRVTINSDDIITSIDSFVELQEKNPGINVSLRHLTTSMIGKEKSPEYRIGETPTLTMWRKLAKVGELSDLRRIFDISKLSDKTKKYITSLDDACLREKFLKKIHFDCGSPDTHFLERQITCRITELVIKRGGVASQAENCLSSLLVHLLRLSTNKVRVKRFVDRAELEVYLEKATQITINKALLESQYTLMEKALSTSLSQGVSIVRNQNVRPNLLSDIPLPKAIANRIMYVTPLLQSLENSGICWVWGGAGMGKTLTARVIAHKNGGIWASINLRGQASEQVVTTLTEASDLLSSFGLRGLIVDDLDCVLESSVLHSLNYLFYSADRLDVLLVV